MRLHLNFATRDLARSAAFYATLLGAPPTKALDAYALFVTDEPPLELALDLDPDATAAPGQHFGIAVDDVDAVDAQHTRLTAAGYATRVERAATCCYANATKVWATDPEGRAWETYVVHAETAARDDAEATCCVTGTPAT